MPVENGESVLGSLPTLEDIERAVERVLTPAEPTPPIDLELLLTQAKTIAGVTDAG